MIETLKKKIFRWHQLAHGRPNNKATKGAEIKTQRIQLTFKMKWYNSDWESKAYKDEGNYLIMLEETHVSCKPTAVVLQLWGGICLAKWHCVKVEITEMFTISMHFISWGCWNNVLSKWILFYWGKCIKALSPSFGFTQDKMASKKWICGDVFSQRCLLQALAQAQKERWHCVQMHLCVCTC